MTNFDNQNEHVYDAVRKFSPQEVEQLLSINNPRQLLYVPIGVSMYSDDLPWAESLCIRLSQHDDPIVRGNAVLGFGHLARRFGTLNLEKILPILQIALHDSEQYVVMQANDAFDDVKHYLSLSNT